MKDCEGYFSRSSTKLSTERLPRYVLRWQRILAPKMFEQAAADAEAAEKVAYGDAAVLQPAVSEVIL